MNKTIESQSGFDSIEDLIRDWTEKLNDCLPPGGFVHSSFREESKGRYRVLFRTRLARRTLVSGSVGFSPLETVQRAGLGLRRQIFRTQQKLSTVRRKKFFYEAA